jgi:hypothetical protein
MALAGWQSACHQLHILVPVFISRTLHVPLGQECVPEPLREVPELGIDVHKQMKRSLVEISRPLSPCLSSHSELGSFCPIDGMWACLSRGVCPQPTWITVCSRHLVTISLNVPFTVRLKLLPGNSVPVHESTFPVSESKHLPDI